MEIATGSHLFLRSELLFYNRKEKDADKQREMEGGLYVMRKMRLRLW